MAKTKYGFIGLGSMGYGMCSNIHAKINANDELYICDINRAQLERFTSESSGPAPVTILTTPKDIAEKCDIILTMLPQSQHVEAVYYTGDNALTSGLSPHENKLCIECSTIDPAVTREIGARVQAAGAEFADAAVSGGPAGANSGTLSHMIGCPLPTLERVLAVMRMTGREESLFHCGPIGSGVTVKLINNYLSVSNILLASEALNLGEKMGLDAKRLTEIISASSGQTWILSKNNPVPGVHADSVASKGYAGGFNIGLAAGCIELANKMARDAGAKMVLGGRSEEVWREAMESQLCKGLDARSIFRWISEG